MDIGQTTITIGTWEFYEVVNALRDSCGCDTCLKNANLLLEAKHKEVVNG